MPDKDIIITAIKEFLKPIVTEVITESLTEAFFSLEQKRRKRYYTRDEVCQRLHIGCTTFYRLANKGKITILKLEGKTLVDADELDKAIETRRVFRYQH
jgi:excisionase family DNA binding protein